jgi:diguanylate cyclase (GGDEF)-like protein
MLSLVTPRSLPATHRAFMKLNQGRHSAPLPPGSELRVLLVEDDPDDALAVKESLRDASALFHFDVTHVTTLAPLRERLAGAAYNIVLCDLGLPDGRPRSRLTDVLEAAGGIPVVVMTGLDDEQVALDAVRTGAEDFLVKGSTDLHALPRILGQTVQRHRLARELERARRRESFLAGHDPLTRLPNRHRLLSKLEQALAEARKSGRMLALLFIDLDRFKPVNDTLGHMMGDRLLRAVADRLSGAVRRGDLTARFGGDEFVVLLRGLAGPDAARAAAEHVAVRLREPFSLDGQTVQIGVSVGIAVFPLHAPDGGTLLRAADRAMYRVKTGGGGIMMWAEDPHGGVAEATLSEDLDRALRSDGLSLHYQPQFDVVSGEMVGAEALLRWHHPKAGTIMPATILPLATETGRMAALGEWVIRSACRQIRRWDEGEEIPVAVNVSAQQILDPAFPARVGEILGETEADPHRLILEIPESGFHDRFESAERVLTELKALGLSIAVDDFGMGQSSFSWLRHLPVDVLKIDRSFVAGMTSNRRGAVIVGALTTMARS